jgi:hypothetical protein
MFGFIRKAVGSVGNTMEDVDGAAVITAANVVGAAANVVEDAAKTTANADDTVVQGVEQLGDGTTPTGQALASALHEETLAASILADTPSPSPQISDTVSSVDDAAPLNQAIPLSTLGVIPAGLPVDDAVSLDHAIPLSTVGVIPAGLPANDTVPLNDAIALPTVGEFPAGLPIDDPVPVNHAIPPSAFGVYPSTVLDTLSINHSTDLDIGVSDPKNLLTGNQAALLEADMTKAASEWLDHLENPSHAPINIRLNITDDSNNHPGFYGGPAYVVSTGTGDNATWESAVEYKLQNGADLDGSAKLSDGAPADVYIDINSDFLTREGWLDPNPFDDGSVVPPSDKVDMVSELMKDFGRGLGLGLLSTLDWRTGTFGAGEKTTWESLLDIETSPDGGKLAYFKGSHAERENGGPVVVNSDTPGLAYQYLGNGDVPTGDAIDPKTGSPDVLYGVAFDVGRRYEVSDLDVAILQDLGYHIKGPVLNGVNIAALAHPTYLDTHSLVSTLSETTAIQPVASAVDDASLTQSGGIVNDVTNAVAGATGEASPTQSGGIVNDVANAVAGATGEASPTQSGGLVGDVANAVAGATGETSPTQSGGLVNDVANAVANATGDVSPMHTDGNLFTEAFHTGGNISTDTLVHAGVTPAGVLVKELGNFPGNVPVLPDTVRSPDSGLVFVNTYGDGVTSKFHDAVVAAERELQGYFKDSVTVSMNFDLQKIDDKFSGQNFFGNSVVQVSYGQLKDALTAHATTSDDYAAVASLPATDPSNGAKFDVAIGMARNLGLAPAGDGSHVDDRIVLNSDFAWNYDQDAIGVLQHEISEGIMGRVSGLGLNGSPDWAPMDLFRYAQVLTPHQDGGIRYVSYDNVHDYTGGADGRPTYFSVDGTSLLTPFHNSIDTNGNNDGQDLGDWGGTSGDAFGPGGPGGPGYLTSVDLQVLDILGWTPTTGILSTFQDHTIHPPIPGPGVPHDDGAPISGNLPASVDQIPTPADAIANATDEASTKHTDSNFFTDSLHTVGNTFTDSLHTGPNILTEAHAGTASAAQLSSLGSPSDDTGPLNHAIPPSALGVYPSSVLDTLTNSTDPDLQIDVFDSNHVLTGNQTAVLQAEMAKAASEWMDHIDNPHHIPIRILLDIGGEGLIGQPMMSTGTGANATLEPEVEDKLQHGTDGGFSDMIFNINPEIMNQSDIGNLLLYGFGQELGIGLLNSLDTTTGTFGADEKTTWESLLDFEKYGTYFTGSHAEMEHGGPVVVGTDNYSLIGNTADDVLDPKTGGPDVMFGPWQNPNVPYEVSDLDVAILQDLGYATKGINIAAMAHPTPPLVSPPPEIIAIDAATDGLAPNPSVDHPGSSDGSNGPGDNNGAGQPGGNGEVSGDAAVAFNGGPGTGGGNAGGGSGGTGSGGGETNSSTGSGGNDGSGGSGEGMGNPDATDGTPRGGDGDTTGASQGPSTNVGGDTLANPVTEASPMHPDGNLFAETLHTGGNILTDAHAGTVSTVPLLSDGLPGNDTVPINLPIPLSTLGVLPADQLSHAAMVALTGFDIDVNDSKNLLTGNQADLIRADMAQAAKEWMDQIDNPNHVPINIQVNISDDIPDGFLANGAPTYLMDTGHNATAESGVEYKLQYGTEAEAVTAAAGYPTLSDGAQADVVININAHDLNSMYLDPNPGTGSAGLPDDKVDMVSLLAHEFGHGLGIGITRALDTSTGTFGDGEKTTWESLLDIETSPYSGKLAYFTGSHAEQEHGGPVVVTTDTFGENYQHFGNYLSDAFDPKHGFRPEVMTGTGLLHGVNYDISPLDVAVLQDLGYHIKGPDLSNGNISQVGHPTPLDIHSLESTPPVGEASTGTAGTTGGSFWDQAAYAIQHATASAGLPADGPAADLHSTGPSGGFWDTANHVSDTIHIGGETAHDLQDNHAYPQFEVPVLHPELALH